MWIILPVKAFRDAKLRLAGVLSPQQRAQLSRLMLEDLLYTLHTSDVVEGVTLISSDQSVQVLADRYKAEFLLTDKDSGYSEDAMQAISTVSAGHIDKIAIIPADIPQLGLADLSRLDQLHDAGLTLCPAVVDGGTNGVLFSPPLPISLVFGVDSLSKYCDEVERCGIPVNIVKITGLERDVDRPADLFWLRNQASGGRTWAYLRDLEITQE